MDQQQGELEGQAAERASKAALECAGRAGAAIVAEITPATRFRMAEDTHQRYLENRRGARRRDVMRRPAGSPRVACRVR